MLGKKQESQQGPGPRRDDAVAVATAPRRRRVGDRWRPLGALVAVSLLAGCASTLPTTLEVAPRTGVELPSDALARAVAERLEPADFVEPDGIDLILQVRDDLLFVKGVVNSGSDDEMIDLLNRSPEVRTVVLTMVGGSVDDETNLALGRKLRSAGMTTYLPAQGMVASGGTDLLVSGSRRIVERGAMVGVHSWGSGPWWLGWLGLGGRNGDEVPRDDPEHKLFLDFYRDMDIPEDFYWFTLEAAPAEGMHWMTEAEMARYRVHTD